MFFYTVNADIKLKLLEISDAENLFKLIDASRDYLRKWLAWINGTKSIEHSRTYIQVGLNQFAANNGLHTGIWWKNQLVGCIGFNSIDWFNRKTTIGYWLAENFQGNGIMTNATQALVNMAFDHYKLNRVQISMATDNYKSRAIPERLGFKEEGCIREAEWANEGFVDHVVYGMLKAEWNPKSQ